MFIYYPCGISFSTSNTAKLLRIGFSIAQVSFVCLVLGLPKNINLHCVTENDISVSWSLNLSFFFFVRAILKNKISLMNSIDYNHDVMSSVLIILKQQRVM